MAGPWFVDSNATGSGVGTSWTNAATTMSACLALAVAAGDQIWVSSTHAESTASSTTITFPGTLTNPNIVVCAPNTVPSPASGDWTTGAVLTVTGGTNFWQIAGSAYFYGLHFVGGNNVRCCGSANGWQYYDNCILEGTASTTTVYSIYTGNGVCTWNNTTPKFGGTGGAIGANASTGYFSWRNSTALPSGSIPTTLFATASWPNVEIRGVDFNAKTSGTLIGALNSGVFSLYGCRINSGVTLAATPVEPGGMIVTQNVDSGANSNGMSLIAYEGTQSTDTTIIRTGGAAFNGVGLAHKYVPALTPYVRPLRSLQDFQMNTTTGSSRNFIVRGIANNATQPTNGQVWSEIATLNNASYPLVGFTSNSKGNNSATASNLTADTSAWDSLVAARANSHTYSAGNAIAVASNAGRVFFCTTGGTTAGSEPGGYATAVDGGTVTDGTATFQAGWRFSLTLAPTPQMVGQAALRIYTTNITGVWIDPKITAT